MTNIILESRYNMSEVINWLEKEMNKQNLFYFKKVSDNEIKAYFKVDDSVFATFYIDKIKEMINWK